MDKEEEDNLKIFEYIINKYHKGKDWSKLPSDFEKDAVKFAYKEMKVHFSPFVSPAGRIKASKAVTFNELRDGVKKYVEDEKKKLESLKKKS